VYGEHQLKPTGMPSRLSGQPDNQGWNKQGSTALNLLKVIWLPKTERAYFFSLVIPKKLSEFIKKCKELS